MSSAKADVAARPREVMIAAGFAVIFGGISLILALTGIADGESPAIGRALVSVVGIAAGVLLWAKPRVGWVVIVAWAALQIPYFAWNTDGSPLAQVLYIPITMTSETTVNGEITSHSSIGVNLIGIILMAIFWKWRNEWLYRNR